MKRIFIFLGLTFLFTWSLAFLLISKGGLSNPFAQYIFISFMLIPAISVILTRLITKEGFRNLRLNPHLKQKGSKMIYLTAWFLPSVLTIIGAILFFILFPSRFDAQMGTMAELIAKQSAKQMPIPLFVVFLLQAGSGILLAPILNFIPCLGEELGWRGYLLPKLCEKVTPPTAALITGIIWGVWHAPMIAMGHNYGLKYRFFPYAGILGMIIFCIFVGAIFSYLSLRVNSAIPAVLAHGSMNGFAAISIWFTKGTSNPFIGPVPVGIIGGIGFLVTGAICFLLLRNLKCLNKSDEIVPVSLGSSVSKE